MLPGDSPEDAVDDVARLMDGLPVTVSTGPLMLPALTDVDDPAVAAMRRAAEAVLGYGLPPTFPAWTFDAGYSVSLGIPTLMFGPSSSEISGEGVLEDDHVAEAAVLQAAAVYAAFMSCRLERRP
jgi:acetylornithine deacetylase/succinyl-diaminopimelate desuccinylase-like protein